MDSRSRWGQSEGGANRWQTHVFSLWRWRQDLRFHPAAERKCWSHTACWASGCWNSVCWHLHSAVSPVSDRLQEKRQCCHHPDLFVSILPVPTNDSDLPHLISSHPLWFFYEIHHLLWYLFLFHPHVFISCHQIQNKIAISLILLHSNHFSGNYLAPAHKLLISLYCVLRGGHRGEVLCNVTRGSELMKYRHFLPIWSFLPFKCWLNGSGWIRLTPSVIWCCFDILSVSNKWKITLISAGAELRK